MALTPAALATASIDLELLEFSANIARAPDFLTSAALSAILSAVASCWLLKSLIAAPMNFTS